MHLRDTRQPCQISPVDAGEILGVASDHLQEVICCAGHKVAFQNIRYPGDLPLERIQNLFGLCRKRDLDENEGRPVKLSGVQQSDIVSDNTGLFQPLNPAMTCRRRQIHLIG